MYTVCISMLSFRMVPHLIIVLFASLLFLLAVLFLLIVIYDGVGTYDEMIIMDWYVCRNCCNVRVHLIPQV